MNKQSLKALIDLSPLSMNQIAKSAEINQGNLSSWFNQDRFMGEETISRLAEELGIGDGFLATDRVYIWRTGRDFVQLRLLLETYFVEPKIIPVVRKRARRYELPELFAQPMAIVVDDLGHKAFLMLRTSVVKDAIKDPLKLSWFSPEYLKGTTWLRPIRDDSRYPFPDPIQLPTDILRKWKNGEISKEAFSNELEKSDIITWQTIIDKCTEMALQPSTVYNWLPLIKSSSGLSLDNITREIESLCKSEGDGR